MTFDHVDMRERKALRRAMLRFLPVLVMLGIIMSVVISYSYYQNTQHKIVDQQQNEIVDAMIDYRNTISEMTSIVRTVKADYIEFLGSSKPADVFTALFVSSITQYPTLDQLCVLDTSGTQTLYVQRENGSAYVVPQAGLADLSDWDYYLETTLLGRHQYLFSALNLETEDGQITTDPDTGQTKPLLLISSPLEVDGQRVGYFMASFLMRDYLDSLRTSLGRAGSYVLMMDDNGYLYNDADDENNFGFCYDPSSEHYSHTITTLFPCFDITADSGSFFANNHICTFTAFTNIYDRSKDYFLSKAASEKQIFLVYYDADSSYAGDLHYSFFHQLIASWKTQLISWAGLLVLYILTVYMIFFYDRIRFTDLFADNRYSKSALRQALRHHQFVNYYQPIINIQDGSMLGFEALSRWKTRGQVLPPSMFMDEVLHFRLGQAIDENAFLLMRKDREKMMAHGGFENTFISVNCCQQTFNSLIKNPPATVIQLTEEEKKYVVLELVENIVFNQKTQEKIRELYQHNILFAIDDFGTGNSNVSFIRNLENLKVKIDRTFVPVDLEDHKERVIIESFVKMFIDQGLRLIVEGVETREQCRYLKRLGIAGVQGFYFSRPMTIDALIDFVERKDYLEKL